MKNVLSFFLQRKLAIFIGIFALIFIGVLGLSVSAFISIAMHRVEYVPKSDFQDFTCPSEEACFALVKQKSSTSVVASRDGGKTWVHHSLAAGVQPVISCATKTICFVVDNSGILQKTVDSGVNWSVPIQLFPFVKTSNQHKTARFNNIRCPSPQICYVLGNLETQNSYLSFLLLTNDGGQTWADISPKSSANTFDAISCPTITTCFLTSATRSIFTEDGGNSWQNQTITLQRSFTFNTNVSIIREFDCPSDRTCYMVGDAIAWTLDKSRTWRSAMFRSFTQSLETEHMMSENLFSSTNPFVSISCPNEVVCYATSYAINISDTRPSGARREYYSAGGVTFTNDAGTTWNNFVSQDIERLSFISCPTITTCFATDAAINRIVKTTDGGKKWTVITLPD